MSKPLLIIDIVADLVCPYCYLGYQRLQQALDNQQHLYDYQLSWQPYQLNPDLSAEGELLLAHLEQKLGRSQADIQATQTELQAQAQVLGLTMNFPANQRLCNTGKAHRLAIWADTYDQQLGLMLALFAAYFTDQQDLNDNEVLLPLVASLGLPVDEAEKVLEQEQYQQELDAKAEQWRKQGIRSVPTYIINERYAISGALDSAILEQGFAELVAAMNKAAQG